MKFADAVKELEMAKLSLSSCGRMDDHRDMAFMIAIESLKMQIEMSNYCNGHSCRNECEYKNDWNDNCMTDFIVTV